MKGILYGQISIVADNVHSELYAGIYNGNAYAAKAYYTYSLALDFTPFEAALAFFDLLGDISFERICPI